MAPVSPGRRRWLAAAAMLGLVGALAGAYWMGLRDDPDVLLVGDSIMRQSGPPLGDHIEGFDVVNAGVNSSGLLNPQVYDWVDALPPLLQVHRPEATVVLFIGNYAPPGDWWQDDDGQPVAPATPAFFAEWAEQADEIVRHLQEAGSEIYWVLPPPVSPAEGAEIVDGLRRVYRDLAERHPDVTLIDASPALSDDGSFTFTVRGRGDEVVQVRAADGVHLTPAGARRLATAITDAVEAGRG